MNPPQHTPEDELTDTEKTIVSYTDPDRFIDLLNWDSFVRGQQDGNIPVERHRIMFKKWLQSYLDTKVREARISTLKRLAGKITPRGDDTHPEYSKGFEEMKGKVKFELNRLSELTQEQTR